MSTGEDGGANLRGAHSLQILNDSGAGLLLANWRTCGTRHVRTLLTNDFPIK